MDGIQLNRGFKRFAVAMTFMHLLVVGIIVIFMRLGSAQEIVRFGLNYDFIEKHNLSWINNLITGSKKNLGSPSHKNHSMPYVQDYIKEFGIRKCEANAIVVIPKIAREFVNDKIKEYLGEDAEKRFLAKRQKIRDEVQKFRKKTGLDKSLNKALELIDKAGEEDD